VDRLNAWRSWSASAPAHARAHFTERSIRDVMLGAQFEMLQTMAVADYGSGLSFLIDAEIDARLQALDLATHQLDEEVHRWGRGRLAIVLDTNVLIAAGPRTAKIRWDDVMNRTTRTANFVVPIQVVEELDRLKDRGPDQTRNNARVALRWLGDLFQFGDHPAKLIAGDADSNATIRVWVDDNERVPLAEVDRDIIDRAGQLQPYVSETFIASMDQSMIFRARAYGLNAVQIESDHIPPREDATAQRR